jgi:elongation factor Ts
MGISAQDVKKLRDESGAGIMDCKNALVEANGDFDAASDILRKKGAAKVGKKSSRVTAEGLIAIKATGNAAAMVEVNCETDFVARESAFIDFVNTLAEVALSTKAKDVDALNSANMPSGETVDATRQALITKIGENMQVRRVTYIESTGLIAAYSHGARIGVLVDLASGDAETAKDIAMHVAASNPAVLTSDDVPADMIAKEREIYTAQAAESGKPQEIIEKMVEGRVKSFLKEVSLCDQPFVKEPKQSVSQFLASKKAEINGFTRFEVGEGIEKAESNFAEEVKAQAGLE